MEDIKFEIGILNQIRKSIESRQQEVEQDYKSLLNNIKTNEYLYTRARNTLNEQTEQIKNSENKLNKTRQDQQNVQSQLDRDRRELDTAQQNKDQYCELLNKYLDKSPWTPNITLDQRIRCGIRGK